MLLLLGFSASFAVSVGCNVSPSKHQRVERQLPGVRSSLPAVCIDVSSLSQTLESIRSELTEILRPSYRRGIVSQPGAAEEEHLSEYSKRQVHFGEPGGSCWIIDLRYPQEHRNTEMDGCYSYFFANCPHASRSSSEKGQKARHLISTQPQVVKSL